MTKLTKELARLEQFSPLKFSVSEEAENSGSCDSTEANRCCSDPTTCLGGEALSTFQEVNNIATQVGPGLGMMLQGGGKDMSGMCQAMQNLAGAGASLSLAASAKCRSAISSCESNCENTIKKQCHTYVNAKNACKHAIDAIADNSPTATTLKEAAEKDFKTVGEPAVQIIKNSKTTQTFCITQRAKSKQLMENMSQMAQAAISSELCKQQARFAKNQKECKAAGGTWKNLECKMPNLAKKQCKTDGGVWKNEECEMPREKEATVNTGNGQTSQLAGLNPLHGSTLGSPPGSDDSEDDDDSESEVGGGGKSTAGGATTSGGLGESISTPGSASIDSSDGTSTGSGDNGQLSGRMSAGSSMFGSTPYGGYNAQNNKRENSDEDGNDLSMGGGGFSGYGGGVGGRDSDYASLGLSKKQLKELKDKQSTKRATASESGGAHQNIFERISKRFQSLCQSKLDCR